MATTKVGIFNVKLVKAGETYWLDRPLKADKPLIEFYDSRYPHGPHGQFISRYYAETLLTHPSEHGLLLDGAYWCVTKQDVALVKEFIKLNT